MIIGVLYLILGTSLFLIFWAFLGYPGLLWLLSKLVKNKHTYDENYGLKVSIIIPCYNEENMIKEKLKNTLSLDYPKEKMQIVIVDDGSNDKTYKIMKEFIKNIGKKVLLVHQERAGKYEAIKTGLKCSRNEIIAITDANALLDKNALRCLVRHFSDENVGGVTLRGFYKNTNSLKQMEGYPIYLKFGEFISKKESHLGCLEHSAGWLQVFRKDLLVLNGGGTFAAIDWNLVLSIINKGYKIIYEPNSFGYKFSEENIKDLFKQKRRIAIGSFQILSKYKYLLNPFKYGFFSLAFFSNKILQMLIPILIPLVFLSSLLIYVTSNSPIFYYLVILQVLLFLFSLISIILPKIRIIPLSIGRFVLIMNLAYWIGLAGYIMKNYGKGWETVKSQREINLINKTKCPP